MHHSRGLLARKIEKIMGKSSHTYSYSTICKPPAPDRDYLSLILLNLAEKLLTMPF